MSKGVKLIIHYNLINILLIYSIMNNNIIILILIIVIILLWILYNNTCIIIKEHLTYTNNCYNTFEKEMKLLKKLDYSYDNSVYPDEIVSNNYNERDIDVYNIFSKV